MGIKLKGIKQIRGPADSGYLPDKYATSLFSRDIVKICDNAGYRSEKDSLYHWEG